MALSQLSDLNGTIQKFFTKAWMDQPQEDFKTPLANSSLLETATIPAHSGQYAEFRKFAHFTPQSESGSDEPITFMENEEPATGYALSSTVIQVPLTMEAGYIELGNVYLATDPIDLMAKARSEMNLVVRRLIHRLVNQRFVVRLTENLRQDAGIVATAANIPYPFKNLFAGGLQQFADITPDDVIVMEDFKRARSYLRNSRVPGIFGTLYAAIITSAVQDQLLEDEDFRDAVKRHRDLHNEAYQQGHLVDYEGMRFMLQDDEYRAALAAGGGAMATRSNAGEAICAHVLAKGAAGYVDFGGAKSLARRRLRPHYKVQDISKTGTGPSVGWRQPVQASVIDRSHGLNIWGCSRFGENMDDLVA